jgi:hypothetical protein
VVQVATLFCDEGSDAGEDAGLDTGQDTVTLGVAFRSANLLKVSLVTVAAMLAICLLTLVETTNTAEAKVLLGDFLVGQ